MCLLPRLGGSLSQLWGGRGREGGELTRLPPHGMREGSSDVRGSGVCSERGVRGWHLEMREARR